jgi:hypothetical protein
MIPRLYASKEANDRYNASRRDVTRAVDPRESTIILTTGRQGGGGGGGQTAQASRCYRLNCASPLRLQTPSDPSLAAGETKTVRVSHFLLQTLDAVGGSTSRLLLCAGVDETTGQRVVALSHTTALSACVLSDWTAPLEEPIDAVGALTYLAAQMITANILRLVPVVGTLVVHEPDEHLAAALQERSRGRAVDVVITTSLKTGTARGWRYIHGDLTRRQILKALPAAPSVFFDLAPSSLALSSEAGRRIAECLPSSCGCYGIETICGSEARFQTGASTRAVAEAVRAACTVLANDFVNQRGRQSLYDCHEEICRSMPPIAGLVHGAMVLRDTLFDSMTFEDFTAVLDPKVKGAQLLDELFCSTPLDFFVVMSSLTAVIGTADQSNYTCANMYMTVLMAQRKKRGLAGSTMSMTSLIGLGFVERSDELDEEYFLKMGQKNMSETDLHWQFAEAVAVGRPAANSGIYPEIASGLVPMYADDTRFKGRWRSDVRFNHLVLERLGPQGLAS